MRHAFVPKNLDMSQFGEKADKIAMILNYVYRKRVYADSSGVRMKRDYTRGIALSMQHLRKVIGENATPLLSTICDMSSKKRQDVPFPLIDVLERIKPAVKGKSAAIYRLTKPYQVRPKIYRLQRTSPPGFKYNKEEMEKTIANWPENYRIVVSVPRMASSELPGIGR